MSVGCVGFEDFSIVAFDDAGHVVHTTVANLDVIAVKNLVKRVFLGEVFLGEVLVCGFLFSFSFC